MTADFLDQKRKEIAARIDELQPLVEEHQRLQAAAAAIDSVVTAAPTGSTRRNRTRTPPAPLSTNAVSPRRRGRPRGSKRAAEALVLIKANPGITIAELAEKMGIKHNYLYRVLPALAQEGRIVKDGRGWRATPHAQPNPGS